MAVVQLVLAALQLVDASPYLFEIFNIVSTPF